MAFGVALDDVLDAARRLEAQGITPLSFFGAQTTEPERHRLDAGAALYFHDPDGHQLE